MANASMTSPALSDDQGKPVWAYVILGAVLIIAGGFALVDAVIAALISAKFIGACAIGGGAFAIFHAFTTKGWISVAWRAVLGLLYVALGIVLLWDPASNELFLTWALGLILAASGCVRIYLGVANFSNTAIALLLSGIFGVAAGAVIVTGWPISGLWAMGVMIGLDLIFQGLAWLVYVWPPAQAEA